MRKSLVKKWAVANIAYTTMLPAVALRIRDPLCATQIDF